jgi:hypothetical protein
LRKIARDQQYQRYQDKHGKQDYPSGSCAKKQMVLYSIEIETNSHVIFLGKMIKKVVTF